MTFILIVEDDEKIAANVLLRLREAGHGATSLRSAEEALAWLRDETNVAPDLLLVDVRLPGMSGVDLLRRLDGNLPPTIVMSGEAAMSETIEAIRLGVHDFLDKPFTRERLLKSVTNGLEHAALRKQVDALREQRGPRILGESEEAKMLRASIARVAATDARVFIRGESGTGKELVAASLHHGSRRHPKPFVKLNCAAIPAHLIEDELFGHARGAFTDAKTPKPGLFEQADGGTLFLDEIGDMELALQSRLLRVLEDGRVRRLGETADRAVSVRVISATHRDLAELVKSGAFREDLFFRLATVPIDVPPLRHRAADVPLLFAAFLEQFCRIHGRALLHVEPEVFAKLRAYEWPGNVRELRNLAERLAVLGGDPVTVDQLPLNGHAPRAKAEETIVPLRDYKARHEREYIERVLLETNWNVTRAAELLDVQRTYLHQKIVTMGLRRP